MKLKICGKCKKPYLENKEFCPNCPEPYTWNQESWVNVGCLAAMIGSVFLLVIFWLFILLGAFFR